ncbi:DUF4294 domain-containing protein [Gelidibacter japonicus]|jgi:hypothetical protein|uniref:DUF4294 domain-containing protein n=1 Tax=Gelidibacter japonicus TaxID=1962232 RepID=UPI0013D5A066|nr:DUF4294 domain-containing protein [Gelidibacter japonicus]MCL8007517.1 DUF4294 domain-containing protein [Gelidibacter japonicus]
MKLITYIFVFLPLLVFAQVDPVEKDSTVVEYYFIDGDSIPVSTIDLDAVLVLSKLKFDNRDDRIRYLILKRRTIKVYPYAKLAAERLVELNKRLETLERKSEKRRYAKIIQRYIEDEFSEELKKLTRKEGQILVKLIHRQTGKTTFQLIQELRSGWRAFWFNNTAKLFDISLKEQFNPLDVSEDYLIEDILERAFQSGQLDRQKSAFPIDYFELTNKWAGKTIKN